METIAATKISAPSVNVSTGESAFTAKWGKVKGATAYQVYYTTDSKFKKSIKTIKTTKTSYTVKKLKSYTKYYIRVKTCTGKKKTPASSYSKTKSVITNVYPTSIQSTTAYEASFKITCKTVSKCKYQVQYSTKSDFSSYKLVSSSEPNIIVRKLGDSSGKALTYYTRVRTYRNNGKKNVYTGWSSSKKITTKKVTFPKTPKVDNITTFVTGDTASFTVNFFNYDNITTAYKVQVATDNTFRNIVKTTGSISKNTITVSGLNQNTVYYYRICAIRNYNGIEYSTAWNIPSNSAFVTGSSNAANAPEISTIQLTNENKICNVNWTMNGNNYDSVSYIVQCSTEAAFNIDDLITSEQTTSELNASFPVAYNNTYYIRIKAMIIKDGNTYYTPWSSIASITSYNPYEIRSSIKVTSTNSTENSITFTWDKIYNATGYEVQCSDDSKFANANIIDTTSNTITVNNLVFDTTYYIRIRAYNTETSQKYYSAWTSATVKTADIKINEGVTYTWAEDAGRPIPNKPCLYSKVMLKDFGYSNSQFSEYYSLLKNAYSEINLDKAKNDIDKFVLITKWIYCNVEYDYDLKCITSYEALKYGKTTCEGFSWLLDDLCYLFNIKCYSVSSDKHEWNIIELDGYWYICDIVGKSGFKDLFDFGDPNKKLFNIGYDDNDYLGGLGTFEKSSKYTSMKKSFRDMIENQNLIPATDDIDKASKPLWKDAAFLAHDTNTNCRIKEIYEKIVDDDPYSGYNGKATYIER